MININSMRIVSILKDRTILMICLAVLSVFVPVAYVLAALHAGINCDTGYYLGVVELLHEGLVPYKDFALGYTPLAMYLLLIPRFFTSSYSIIMLFHSLILFTDAVLLAVCVYKEVRSVLLSWTIGLVFLVLSYYLEGIYLYLEPYSIFFGECAMLVMLSLKEKGASKRRFVLLLVSGALSSLAFLSKQYGIVFAAYIGIMALLSSETWKRKVLDCIVLFCGFCVPVVLVVFLFAINDGSISELYAQLSGNGYGDRSLGMYKTGVFRVLRLFPWLFFVPVLVLEKDKRKRTVVLSCVAGTFLVSLQFYFFVWSHYYLFLLPFVLLLFGLIWQSVKSSDDCGLLYLLLYGMFFTSSVIPLQEVYKTTMFFAKVNQRAGQMENASRLKMMKQECDIEYALCLDETVQYYYLCPFKPAGMEKYGFSFGRETEDVMCERLKEADCFIIREKDAEKIMGWMEFNKCLSDSFVLVNTCSSDNLQVFIREDVYCEWNNL